MLALAAGAVLEIVNVGLAVLLLTAGIATLRESLKSPRLHNWWALLKFPAVVLSTATGIWIAVTMFDGFGMTATQTAAGGNTAVTTPVFGSMGWLMAIPAIGMGLVACIYPIIILVLFRTRTVREYYAEMRRNSWVAG
jgi:hypothetical protein